MKLNMSKSIIAVLIPALIGIIGCSDNPITSAGENAESGKVGVGAENTGVTQKAKATKGVKGAKGAKAEQAV